MPTWIKIAPTGPTSGFEVLLLIQNLTNWLFVGFMLLAVIFIILAAWQFISAGGDPTAITKARSKLLWAGIAIVVAVVSRAVPVVVQSILEL